MDMNSEKVKISVIMPVHDTGECLAETLKSILAQIFTDFELICVDDCSQEKATLSILAKYESADSRMHLVRIEESRGAANARNTGLEMSKGEYVIFLDSDDLFSENLLETLWVAAKAYKADVVICNTGKIGDRSSRNGAVPDGIPKGKFRLNDLGDSGLVDCGLVPWNKLVSWNLIRKEEITFQPLSSCNDVSFSCLTLLNAAHIVHCGGEKLVFWRGNRQGQINKNRNPRNLFLSVMDVLEKSKDPDEYAKIIYVLMRQGIPELRQSVNEDYSREFYALASEYLMKADEYGFKDEESRMLLKLYTKLPYESKWWETDKIYYSQLKVNNEDIMNEIPDMHRTICWGCGKRGEAFLEFAECQGWKLAGVCDKDENKARDFGRRFSIDPVTVDKVRENADMIIASNSKIYENVRGNIQNMIFMDLERYCPDW